MAELNKPYIIAADDEPTVLRSVVNQLKNQFEYTCSYETAESLEELEELIEELVSKGKEIKVLICDWLIPPERADEVLIRIHKKYPGIALIMLSGYADEASILRAKQHANLKAFIAKPWDEKDLIDEVKKYIL